MPSHVAIAGEQFQFQFEGLEEVITENP